MGLVFRESPNLGNEPKLTLLPVRKRLKSPSNFFQNWRAGRRGTARRSRAGSSLRFDPPHHDHFRFFASRARRAAVRFSAAASEAFLARAERSAAVIHGRVCRPVLFCTTFPPRMTKDPMHPEDLGEQSTSKLL